MTIVLMALAILLEIPVFCFGLYLTIMSKIEVKSWYPYCFGSFTGVVYMFGPIGLLRFETAGWAVLVHVALLALTVPIGKWLDRAMGSTSLPRS